MSLKQRFKAEAGEAIFLEANRSDTLESYLRENGWLKEHEAIRKVEKPGEGNMNLVLRAITPERNLIIKQARPWVEKYPQIDAPLERIQTEAAFYQLVQQNEKLAVFTPQLLAWDPDHHIMILEDLGEGADFTYLYQKGQSLTEEEITSLMAFISILHNQVAKAEQQDTFPANQALKKLNHEHIFHYPYLLENDFDLDTIQPGLQKLSLPYKKDATLKARIGELGKLYLGEGPCLIHGDYYPGSWLKVKDGVKVIDPEFGYFGLPEFDLGITIAHLKMARLSSDTIKKVHREYQPPKSFDQDLHQAFTGVEIMRRLIGLAQLPLSLSIKEKDLLLNEAYSLLKL